MLKHDRVSLLGHDGADLDKGVVDPQESGFRPGPDQQLMDEPGDTRHRVDQRLHRFQEVIAGADRVVPILDNALEPEQARSQLPIDWKARGGERGHAQRAPVDTFPGGEQPGAVALQWPNHAKQLVSEGRWLCRLGMGDAGHDTAGVRLREIEQDGSQRDHLVLHGIEPLPQPQPRHRRRQVVP